MQQKSDVPSLPGSVLYPRIMDVIGQGILVSALSLSRKHFMSILWACNQCCGSETFISDPVLDPDPAFSEFRIRIRFRIQIWIRIRILDSNPDPDPEFESGLETGQNFFFLNVKNKLKKLGLNEHRKRVTSTTFFWSWKSAKKSYNRIKT